MSKGFTLIELIVVIFIIAILGAIAIPKIIGHENNQDQTEEYNY